MNIDQYLNWISRAIKHGVIGNGNIEMFEVLLDEYLRVLYR